MFEQVKHKEASIYPEGKNDHTGETSGRKHLP